MILIVLGLSGFSQTQPQLENPGFESWENAGTVVDEPTDWSSIKTSDNEQLNNAAPQVWEQSTEAHTGSYSVRLENKSTFGIVATGTLTNGRVHTYPIADSGYVYTIPDDPRWCTPFTGRPDSIGGWFRFYPVDNDKGKLTAILHVNSGALPKHGTQDNWVAHAEYIFPPDTVDTWMRFSVPFEYFKPDAPQFILLVLNSGYRTQAIAGSVAYFDDIELIYNPGSINESSLRGVNIYYYDHCIYLKELPDDLFNSSTFFLIDLDGNIILTQPVTSDVLPVNIQLPAGIYIGKIAYKKDTISMKIFID